eukprot:363937-Chlamydomonas_euryale.AAC.8
MEMGAPQSLPHLVGSQVAALLLCALEHADLLLEVAHLLLNKRTSRARTRQRQESGMTCARGLRSNVTFEMGWHVRARCVQMSHLKRESSATNASRHADAACPQAHKEPPPPPCPHHLAAGQEESKLQAALPTSLRGFEKRRRRCGK